MSGEISAAEGAAPGNSSRRQPGWQELWQKEDWWRKVEPFEAALSGFDAWVSGRKRYHGGARAALPLFEQDPRGRIKINPLAGWSKDRVEAEFALRNLPRHPLEAQGYLSIGCITCTDRVRSGEDMRAGRWRDLAKAECGIHGSNRPRSAT